MIYTLIDARPESAQGPKVRPAQVNVANWMSETHMWGDNLCTVYIQCLQDAIYTNLLFVLSLRMKG